jgi:hypothetical protein
MMIIWQTRALAEVVNAADGAAAASQIDASVQRAACAAAHALKEKRSAERLHGNNG